MSKKKVRAVIYDLNWYCAVCKEKYYSYSENELCTHCTILANDTELMKEYEGQLKAYKDSRKKIL